MTVKCLMYYAPGAYDRCRFLASEAKIEYLLQCFQRLGWKVEILSACRTAAGKPAPGEMKSLGQGITLELLPCTGGTGWAGRKLSSLRFYLRLTRRLLEFVRPGDTLWVYHALPMMLPLWLLKKMRHFRMVLEMEELYGDVLGNAWIRSRECSFCGLADGFLVPVESLNRKINPGQKPFAVCHGPYICEKTAAAPICAGLRHVVYAGSSDPRKGAFLAVEAACCLPEGYHVHILGKKTPALAEAMHRADCRCILTHDGILEGQAYRDFLRKCHVGLCTQDRDAVFNASSFPSKLLTYLSCGLQVVCPPIPGVVSSGVGAIVHYYGDAAPEAVARTIRKAAERVDDRGIRQVCRLDREFLPELKELLKPDGKEQ